VPIVGTWAHNGAVKWVVVVFVVGMLVGFPAWMMLTGKNRGVFTERPKHPFRLPLEERNLDVYGQSETRLQEHLDLPPVDEPGRERDR
jgi:hypothetical protein